MTSASAGPAASGCCSPSAGLDPALDADRIAAAAAALSSPIRVQLLDVLRRSETEVCQCELLALFGVGQPLLSHHIKRLVEAGLVVVERRHRWAWYSVSPDALTALAGWLA